MPVVVEVEREPFFLRQFNKIGKKQAADVYNLLLLFAVRCSRAQAKVTPIATQRLEVRVSPSGAICVTVGTTRRVRREGRDHNRSLPFLKAPFSKLNGMKMLTRQRYLHCPSELRHPFQGLAPSESSRGRGRSSSC